MTRLDHTTRLATTIGAYMGVGITHIEVVPDPYVEDVHAVRVTVAGTGEQATFLVEGPLDRVTEDDLIDVMFTDWPPTSKGA